MKWAGFGVVLLVCGFVCGVELEVGMRYEGRSDGEWVVEVGKEGEGFGVAMAAVGGVARYEVTAGRYWAVCWVDWDGDGERGRHEACGVMRGIEVRGEDVGVAVEVCDVDEDGDGLGDWWEVKHFGGLEEVWGGDFDGDGYVNGEEYEVGRDPKVEWWLEGLMFLEGMDGRVGCWRMERGMGFERGVIGEGLGGYGVGLGSGAGWTNWDERWEGVSVGYWGKVGGEGVLVIGEGMCWWLGYWWNTGWGFECLGVDGWGAGVETGGWHYLTGTYEGGVARYYVDGVLMGEGIGEGMGRTNSGVLAVCLSSGVVDEVRVYSRALSSNEVWKLAWDSDFDGLPDRWELEHFGDLECRPEGDADRDGWRNLDEYWMGSDPARAPAPEVVVFDPYLRVDGETWCDGTLIHGHGGVLLGGELRPVGQRGHLSVWARRVGEEDIVLLCAEDRESGYFSVGGAAGLGFREGRYDVWAVWREEDGEVAYGRWDVEVGQYIRHMVLRSSAEEVDVGGGEVGFWVEGSPKWEGVEWEGIEGPEGGLKVVRSGARELVVEVGEVAGVYKIRAYNPECAGCKLEAELEVKRASIDVDVDDNGVGDDEEEQMEDMEGREGKLIGVYEWDCDGDGVIDWADFDGNGVGFVRMDVGASVRRGSVRFLYDGGDSVEVREVDGGWENVGGGRLRLWRKDGWEERDVRGVGEGGDYVKPGEWYEMDELGMKEGRVVLYVECLEGSRRKGDLRVVGELDVCGDGDVDAEDAVRLTGVEVDIGMDADRDGVIEFDGEDEEKTVFWVNDDRDVERLDDQKVWVQDDEVGGEKDCEDSTIGHTKQAGKAGCERDLEDFTRLYLRVNEVCREVEEASYWLRLGKKGDSPGQPMINVFEAVDGTLSYVQYPEPASNQICKASLTPEGVGDAEIGGEYIKKGGEISPFLVEGRNGGEGDLVFVIKVGGREVCRKGISVDLRQIERFYDVCRVGLECGRTWDAVVSGKYSYEACGYDGGGRDRVIVVHGWNMEEREKRRWAETVFKRLWHLGYKGKVILYSWPTLWGFEGLDVVLYPQHFDDSEYRAWQSAEGLSRLMEELGGDGEVVLLAHSMGNVVAGEALRGYEGRRVKAYIACQAAVSGQFYDSAVARRHPCKVAVRGMYFPQTPDIMGHYATGDNRSGPYLGGNEGKVERMWNFYNPLDYALRHWERNNVLKPDGQIGHGFGYRGRKNVYEEGRDGFYRNRFGPGGVTRLSVTNEVERYRIFSYCAESRSCALGQAENGGFKSGNWDLSEEPKEDGGGMGYDNKHYSHSRQFRSHIVAEREFWEKVSKDCELDVWEGNRRRR